MTATPAPEPEWFKSTFSNNGSGCVEVATNLLPTTGEILLRDSKNPSTPPFHFNREEWDAFLLGVHAGQFKL